MLQKNNFSRRDQFSRLGKIMAVVAITAVGMVSLLKFAWAAGFTEELAKARLNGKVNFTEQTEEKANPAPVMADILGTTVVAQICILVRDIEKTAKEYGDFFGLQYRITESAPADIANAVYNGKPTNARCKMAFFQLGSIQLELIQPDELPSVWREDLDRNGEGLHHLGFFVKDTDNVLKKLEGLGMRTRMTGGWGTGRFAYVDAYDKLKIIIETLENTTN